MKFINSEEEGRKNPNNVYLTTFSHFTTVVYSGLSKDNPEVFRRILEEGSQRSDTEKPWTLPQRKNQKENLTIHDLVNTMFYSLIYRTLKHFENFQVKTIKSL